MVFNVVQDRKRFSHIITPLVMIVLLSSSFSPLIAEASTTEFDFSTSADFIYDASKISVANNQASLLSTTSPAWYSSSWAYRKKITIDHTKVSGDLTDFPVLVSTTDTDLKDTDNGGYVAQADGGDFVFTSSDGTTALSYELQDYDNTTGELNAWVKVPSLSSTSDTNVYLYYGNATVTNGESPSNVWDTNFQMVQHVDSAGSMQDSTSNNSDGTLTGLANIALMLTATSPDTNSHQGIARDSTSYYTIDTDTIKKYDSSWTLGTTKSTATTDVGDSTNHLGDGEIYNSQLYIPAETYSSCVAFSHQYISVWNTSNLSFVTKYSISAQAHEASGLTIDPTAGTNGTIYAVSYCDGTKIWKYDLSNGTYLGSISLSQTINQIQGITLHDGFFYISDDENDLVWKVSTSGSVVGSILSYSVAGGSFEGVDYTGGDLSVILDQGSGNKKVYTWTDAYKFGDVLEFRKAQYMAANVTLADNGSISFWFYPKSPFFNFNTMFDNSADGNAWEMWIYNDGRINGRISNTETATENKVEYDLDNLSGVANWYYIVFSWQRTGNKTLYVNGVSRNSNAVTWQTPGTTFYMGGGNVANTKADGYADEIRISNTQRSAAWIATEFANESATSTFYTMGSQGLQYASDKPTLQLKNPILFTSLSGFSESADTNGGDIRYQLSNDNGQTWYWYNSGWTVTTSGYSEANSASDINAHISTLPLGDGQLLFRAYFNSNGTQLIELNGIGIDMPSSSSSRSGRSSGGGSSVIVTTTSPLGDKISSITRRVSAYLSAPVKDPSILNDIKRDIIITIVELLTKLQSQSPR
ncbi:DUF2341 domain-containing protein [Candidatus Parcubacteria bacterium]|nr:DUF2341 domain-containing protein [Candidatus Parcubacteria bacterium]